MIILKKNPDKDFIILNITDPQLSNEEWGEGNVNRAILEYTITELVKRAKPDLITISGDLAWAGNDYAYEMLAEFLEQFQIPWAPIWGNHDNQGGAEYIDKIATKYMTYPHCIYEKGNPDLGNGNYIIGIEEKGKIVEALFMLDSHNQDDYADKDGNERKVWAKLIPEQIDWYKTEAKNLKEQGCKASAMILHIPIYAYQTASNAAYKAGVDLASLTVEEAAGETCWNAGYQNSVGVQHEAISSYPEEDNVFAAIQDAGITQYVIAGHDHVNNWMITYEGVRLIFSLKLGTGCYWDSRLNGGTVLKVNTDGIYDVFHEYVDVSKYL